MLKVSFYTLGCKVNQNETGALQQLFCRAGYRVVQAGEAADVFVVNSCTVTAAAAAKSLRALNRARAQNPGAVTVLTGCFAQASPAAGAAAEADVVTGAARGRILEDIEKFLATRRQVVDITPHTGGQPYENLPHAPQSGRTRAFIKIQDGCSRRCAYCIIPAARGPGRSRGEEDILQELNVLAAKGYAEAVFTGINLSCYGRDTGADIAGLVERAAMTEGIKRIRLGSLEPDLLTDSQIDRFAACGKLCPHFHLSLQSGSDAVLRRMRRPYDTALFFSRLQRLRGAYGETRGKERQNPGLCADVIVGFPGETEAEFAETLQCIRQAAFLKVHVFPFSSRPGTAAAAMDGQLPKKEKAARSAAAQEAAEQARAVWISKQEGTPQQVLLETPLAGGLFSGYTGSYIPVAAFAPHRRQGDVVSGVLGAWDGKRAAFTAAK